LETRAGTQVVVRDLAVELRRQGHTPLVYSPRLGATAQEIAGYGIEVIGQLEKVSQTPDLIHGHHHPQVVEALLRFPSIPAIYVCHAAGPSVEEPFYHPRILRYLGVDGPCQERIERTPDIPRACVEMSLNAVDLERFRRRDPLPSRPRRALVFSNYATRATQLPAIRKACRKAGLELEVIGHMAGSAVSNPEEVLPHYDIVFAKGRCALEALAVGNAVVVCDFGGVGAMVSSGNFESLRGMTFGGSVLTNPLKAEFIAQEIARYDATDTAAVCSRVRNEAGLSESVRRWISLYEDVRKEFQRSPRDYDQEFIALGNYLKRWNYGRRVDWEREQLRKVGRVPIIGGALLGVTRRVLRKWTGNYGLN
jgi:hypothetical protein